MVVQDFLNAQNLKKSTLDKKEKSISDIGLSSAATAKKYPPFVLCNLTALK